MDFAAGDRGNEIGPFHDPPAVDFLCSAAGGAGRR